MFMLFLKSHNDKNYNCNAHDPTSCRVGGQQNGFSEYILILKISLEKFSAIPLSIFFLENLHAYPCTDRITITPK